MAVLLVVFLLIVFFYSFEHACPAAVAVYGAAFASASPCRLVELSDKLFAYVVWQVDGDGYRVVDPLLNSTLHLHFLEPVDVVGCSVEVRRGSHQRIEFVGGVFLVDVVAIDFHPLEELMVVDDIFFEAVAHFIDDVDMHVLVVGVHFSAAFVHHLEHRFYT